jgi:predicted dehydrogenase
MIRWGVIATGGIATRFADAMSRVDEGQIVAVTSRSADRAAIFADRWGIERRYYDDSMAGDPDLDVVYVATPHARHADDTIRCLEAGKPVLCEKPFALSAAQARRMVEVGTERQLFLMEAIWSRFLPAYRALTDVLESGRIGAPLQVDADFGFARPIEPSHRLFNPELGGGALLDLGIYPLQLCVLVLGPISQIGAVASIGPTGVDERVAASLRHAAGGLGIIKASLTTPLACTARISGTEGWIELPAFMHCPRSLSVHHSGVVETVDCGFEGDGLEFEIAEVHRCLKLGLTESPFIPLSETVALATAMDEMRQQIGLRYPGEN